MYIIILKVNLFVILTNFKDILMSYLKVQYLFFQIYFGNNFKILLWLIDRIETT